MEQRKSDISNEDGNVINATSNGLNYSFDFSSQVEHPEGQGAPMVGPQPVNQGVAPVTQPNVVQTNNIAPMGVNIQSAGQVTPEPVQPAMQVTPEPVQPTAPVTPEPVQPAMPVTPEPVQPTAPVTPEPVQPTVEPVQMAEAVPAEDMIANNTGVNVQATEGQSQAEVQVNQDTQVSQTQGDEPIIKDKKSTKVFLFVIVGLIVVFIILLPLIFSFIG